MPANSRDTQGPQNKDKASLTPHQGRAHRQARPGGPKPGSQEHPRQENEVSARAGVGTGVPSGTRCQVAIQGLTLSLGRLTCLSCGWQMGFLIHSWGLREGRQGLGAFPGTPGNMQLETGDFVQILPQSAEAHISPSAGVGCCPQAKVTFLLLPTRLTFLFSSSAKNIGLSPSMLCELDTCLCVYLC